MTSSSFRLFKDLRKPVGIDELNTGSQNDTKRKANT